MDLITRLKVERDGRVHGGIYDITQKHFAYNSNKIEGSRLTEEQTSFIYEQSQILVEQASKLMIWLKLTIILNVLTISLIQLMSS